MSLHAVDLSAVRAPNPAPARVRVLEDVAELIQAARLFRTAMVGLPNFGPVDAGFVADIYEPGRALGAFVSGTLVGTVNSYASTLTVPGGGRLAHAAVTHVGVLPTHTRRGIGTALLERQLAEARSRGDAVATLRASDARIYAHFGYGIASSQVSFDLATEGARLRPGVARDLPVRFVELEEAWSVLPAIHAQAGTAQAGAIARWRGWWHFQRLRQDLSKAPAYVVVAGEEGRERGYVRYHPIGLDEWFAGSDRTLVVDDLVAADDAAYGALVAHLLNVDLVHRILFPGRPVDDALPWLFENHRQVRVTGQRDETWLRLLDVRQALETRRYAGEGEVVLAVSDPLFAENNGQFRISALGAVPTDAAAQAELDVGALAAAYLSGTRWWQLARAGRVKAESEAVLSTLDTLFATSAHPHAGTVF
ncbi:GNAT family N-acetyltransferase [Labrys neptuniae]|uniref:GNAT family N-acetyltransferase n=1 Tax=Labrys neptuniae TaxID=376174 RepID=A0ABV3PXL4_9HYPH|nr:GNAT family N-acetyltransferase [Labrys neptuniae]MDT3381351.1 GNAT family N-acetyltransferase [Labrys neptuniae]